MQRGSKTSYGLRLAEAPVKSLPPFHALVPITSLTQATFHLEDGKPNRLAFEKRMPGELPLKGGPK